MRDRSQEVRAVESHALTLPERQFARNYCNSGRPLANRNAFLEFFEPVQYYVDLLRGLGAIRRRRRQDDDQESGGE
jgi:hypothetical protein